MNIASQKKPVSIVATGPNKRPLDQFKNRQSDELVIAFSGPIGCGIRPTIEEFDYVLKEAGYQVVRIKISEFIEDAINRGVVALEKTYGAGRAERYDRLQTAGNTLRAKYKAGDILAEYAVKKIAEIRTAEIPQEVELEDHIPPRRAYLVDQLKHPAEVSLLRAVYRNLFYLVGVLSVFEKRKRRLEGEKLSPVEAASVIERDRKEPDEFGQQIDKTLQLADFFIRNDKPNADQLRTQIRRFVGLMHGENGITPTRHEYGMYVAYAAGLSSACLSRQVGAALLDQEGNVLSSGRNDVPKSGGGLYTAESGEVDARCVKLEDGRCWNDFHKSELTNQVTAVIAGNLKPKWSAFTQKMADEITNKLGDKGVQISQPAKDIIAEVLKSSRITEADTLDLSAAVSKNTKIKDLIEFSRSIHAEMDALISVARQGGGRLLDSTMYVTTFPCHSCARHIVAAGIRTVYYIEPYEKSLAGELHSDSISLEPDNGGDGDHRKNKVEFVHFEGVAPRQYISMFLSPGERKDKGVAIVVYPKNSKKTALEYLDDYRAFETKVVQHLEELTKP